MHDMCIQLYTHIYMCVISIITIVKLNQQYLFLSHQNVSPSAHFDVLVLERVIDQHNGKVDGCLSIELPLYSFSHKDILEMNHHDGFESSSTAYVVGSQDMAYRRIDNDMCSNDSVKRSDYDSDGGHVCVICADQCYCYDEIFIRNVKTHNLRIFSKSSSLGPYICLENESRPAIFSRFPSTFPKAHRNHQSFSSEMDREMKVKVASDNASHKSLAIIDENKDFDAHDFNEDNERKESPNSGFDGNDDDDYGCYSQVHASVAYPRDIMSQLMQEPVRAKDFESLLHSSSFLKATNYFDSTDDNNMHQTKPPLIMPVGAAHMQPRVTSSKGLPANRISVRTKDMVLPPGAQNRQNLDADSDYATDTPPFRRISTKAVSKKKWDAIDDALSGL